jgi:hypothetical protein
MQFWSRARVRIERKIAAIVVGWSGIGPVWGLVLGGSCLLGLACGSGESQEAYQFPLQQRLHDQIHQSSLQAISYDKAVTNRNATPATVEQAEFAPIPWLDSTQAKPNRSLLHQELSYAWEGYFGDPELADQFELRQNGDSLISVRKPAYANRPGLVAQTWVIQPADSTVRFFSTQQQQRSWLYANDVHLTITFDEQGRYLSHRLEIDSRVPLLDQQISALIEGQNAYAP